MFLTKLGHSCFRVETGGATLVLDPGGWSDPGALEGADAVLITHEHADHFQPEWLAEAAATNPQLEVWTNESVAAKLPEALRPRVHTVGPGDSFTAAGVEVSVHGGEHACIHSDIPLVANVGFFLPGALFHPGDALTIPDRQVDTLLAPAAAPWLKISELIDWLRAVGPEQAYLMHDAILSDVGLGLVEQVASGLSPAAVSRLTNGERFEI
ncbi:MAG TPA: MBL fold metallo-hydrolase [Frankiaceae bacterium]|nr:MBL fold metallo-hydrolase [Frankiaceae bacterium]